MPCQLLLFRVSGLNSVGETRRWQQTNVAGQNMLASTVVLEVSPATIILPMVSPTRKQSCECRRAPRPTSLVSPGFFDR